MLDCKHHWAASGCSVRGHTRWGAVRRKMSAQSVFQRRKDLWVCTNNQGTYTGSVEAGVQNFVLGANSETATKWRGLAAAAIHEMDAEAESGGPIRDHQGRKIGTWEPCNSGESLKELESRAEEDFGGTLVVSTSDWSIIPAENLVAAFQNSQTKLMMAANTAEEGRTLLGALEIGVDGVVLCSDDVAEVRQLQAFMQDQQRSTQRMDLEVAVVTRVESVGMGDRVCVDLCSNMSPGEGMLVGNFCRTLFLVHSECAESAYINSRPFRVNAGPVHAYTAVSGDKTAYLAELKAGKEVLVVAAHGLPRSEVVGRCKVERRPLVLLAAETADSVEHSILLQNAETVKLVGPLHSAAGAASAGDAAAQGTFDAGAREGPSIAQRTGAADLVGGKSTTGGVSEGGNCMEEKYEGGYSKGGVSKGGSSRQRWRAVAVTDMRPGVEVLVKRAEEGQGRHMGTAVQETLNEW